MALNCKIIAVGTKPPRWVQEAVEDYQKRFPSEVRMNLIEVKAATRGPTGSVDKWMSLEANAIEQQLTQRTHLVILDERGTDLTTKQLAKRMQHWREESLDVAIVIGGADGIDDRLKQRAQETIRLSSLTLPHAMVRVLLIEQLFRAWSLLNNHPYHRE